MNGSIFDILGGVTSVVGLVGSFSGFISWLYERKSKNKLIKENSRRIWSDISKIRGLMSDLEKDSNSKVIDTGKLQAIGKLSNMLRDLIKEACQAEKRLDIKTVKSWRKLGKLGSEWQEQLALSVLLSEELDAADLESIPDLYGSWDEVPDTHPASAKRHSTTPKEN